MSTYQKFSTDASAFVSHVGGDQEFFIFVKTLTGRTATLSVHSDETVGELKRKLYDKLGCTPASQKLIFGGKLLMDDSFTMRYHNINKEAMIHLIVKLSEPEPKEKKEDEKKEEPEEEPEIIQQDKVYVIESETFSARLSVFLSWLASNFYNQCTSFCTMLFNLLPVAVMRKIWRAFYEQWQPLINYITSVIDPIYSALVRANTSIVNGIGRVLRCLIEYIVKPVYIHGIKRSCTFIYQGCNSLCKYIKTGCVALWEHLIRPFSLFVKNTITSSWLHINRIWNTFCNAIKSITRTLRSSVITPIITMISNILITVRTNISLVFNMLYDALVSTQRAIRTNVITPTVTFITNILTTIRTYVSSGYDAFVRTLRAINTNVITPTVTIITNMLTAIHTFFVSGCEALVRTLRAIRTNVITPTITFVNLLTTIRINIFRTFNALTRAIKNYIILPTWNGITAVARFCKSILLSFARQIRTNVSLITTNTGRQLLNALRVIWKHGILALAVGLVDECANMLGGFVQMIKFAYRVADKSYYLVKRLLVVPCYNFTKSALSFTNSKIIIPFCRMVDRITSSIVLFIVDDVVKPIGRIISKIVRKFANLISDGISFALRVVKRVIRLVTSTITSFLSMIKSAVRIVINHGIAPFFRSLQASITDYLNCVKEILEFVYDITERLCRNVYRICNHYVPRVCSTISSAVRYTIIPPYNWCVATCSSVFRVLINPAYHYVKRTTLSMITSSWNAFKASSRFVYTTLCYYFPSRLIGRILQWTWEKVGIPIVSPCFNSLSFVIQQIARISRFATWLVHGDQRAVRNQGYGLDIRPAIISNNVREGSCIHYLQDQQEYTIWIQNKRNITCECKISIDESCIGVFRLAPGKSYLIEHPVDDNHRFKFEANPENGAVKNSRVTAQNSGWVRATFTPELVLVPEHQTTSTVVRSKNRQNLDYQNSSITYEPTQSQYDTTDDIHQDNYVIDPLLFGATSFTGKVSEQQAVAVNNHLSLDQGASVTISTRLAVNPGNIYPRPKRSKSSKCT